GHVRDPLEDVDLVREPRGRRNHVGRVLPAGDLPGYRIGQLATEVMRFEHFERDVEHVVQAIRAVHAESRPRSPLGQEAAPGAAAEVPFLLASSGAARVERGSRSCGERGGQVCETAEEQGKPWKDSPRTATPAGSLLTQSEVTENPETGAGGGDAQV